eukprot:7863560-Alexandrium_andersonii.AAC.1
MVPCWRPEHRTTRAQPHIACRRPAVLPLQDGATHGWGATMDIRKRSADGWRHSERGRTVARNGKMDRTAG